MTKFLSPTISCAASITRGMDFLHRVGATTDGFDKYGKLLICCFALIAATSSDPHLRQLAGSRARKLAHRWMRSHPRVPSDVSAQTVLGFILVRYALARIGFTEVPIDAELRVAASGFSAEAVLGFDPALEPPPHDLPYICECGLSNYRGRTFCKKCRRRLLIQNRYRVWMRALATTYVSERCGINFGSRYVDVFKWVPKMRPYPAGAGKDIERLRDAIYAVTHLVYTVNDYGSWRLAPDWLPFEFAFLKKNVHRAIKRNDPEILGELLDSLKAFGLRETHPLIDSGTKYLLRTQNEDGSWGDPAEENIRTRCHTTWTAIDGLRSYAWRRQPLSRFQAKTKLKVAR